MTNKELAEQYKHVAMQYIEGDDNYKSEVWHALSGINKCYRDIRDIFRQDGNLDALRGTRICPEARNVLELILEKGVEQAYEKVGKQREEELARRNTFSLREPIDQNSERKAARFSRLMNNKEEKYTFEDD